MSMKVAYIYEKKKKKQENKILVNCWCIGCWKEDQHPHPRKVRKGLFGFCLFACFECKELAEQTKIIKCFECNKEVDTTFNSRERRVLYTKGIIAYLCADCVFNKNISDWEKIKKDFKGAWISPSKDREKALFKGHLLSLVMKKEKITGEYYTGKMMDYGY